MQYDYPPCCPDGRVINTCARTVYRQRVEGAYTFGGLWSGWRISGPWLIGPHGVKFKPVTLQHAYRLLVRQECEPQAHQQLELAVDTATPPLG